MYHPTSQEMNTLQQGMRVYFLEENHVYSGKVIELQKTMTGFTFQIDSYGTCEGLYTIDSSQLGISVFQNKEEAEHNINRNDHD